MTEVKKDPIKRNIGVKNERRGNKNEKKHIEEISGLKRKWE